MARYAQLITTLANSRAWKILRVGAVLTMVWIEVLTLIGFKFSNFEAIWLTSNKKMMVCVK